MNNEALNKALSDIDEIARNVCRYDYGLPIHDDGQMALMREALRAALAETQGAVAWMHPDGRVVSGETMKGARKDGGAILSSLKSHNIPLYITPPSVDALIAEIDELPRYAGERGELCIYFDDLSNILDKYRARGGA